MNFTSSLQYFIVETSQPAMGRKKRALLSITALSYPNCPLCDRQAPISSNFCPPNTGRPPHLSHWHQFATRSAIPQLGPPMEWLCPSMPPHSWIHGASLGTGKLQQRGAGLVWFCGVWPSCLHPLLTTAYAFINRKKQWSRTKWDQTRWYYSHSNC